MKKKICCLPSKAGAIMEGNAYGEARGAVSGMINACDGIICV